MFRAFEQMLTESQHEVLALAGNGTIDRETQGLGYCDNKQKAAIFQIVSDKDSSTGLLPRRTPAVPRVSVFDGLKTNGRKSNWYSLRVQRFFTNQRKGASSIQISGPRPTPSHDTEVRRIVSTRPIWSGRKHKKRRLRTKARPFDVKVEWVGQSMLIYVTAIDSDQTLSPSCLISVKGDAPFPFQEVMKESESIIESVYED